MTFEKQPRIHCCFGEPIITQPKLGDPRMTNDIKLNNHVQELKKDLTHKHYVLTAIFLLNAYFMFYSTADTFRSCFLLGLMFCVLVDTTSQKRLIDALKILQTSEGE